MMDTSGNPVVAHPAGSTVASLLGTSVTDPNVTDPAGIAVTAAVSSATKGRWQFLLAGDTIWQDVGTVSAGSALLLRATDLVRFVPAPGFLGPQMLSFKAWDQTEFAAGEKHKTTTLAFSKETETAIVNVNTAPSLTL
jgi:hypothetical protein